MSSIQSQYQQYHDAAEAGMPWFDKFPRSIIWGQAHVPASGDRSGVLLRPGDGVIWDATLWSNRGGWRLPVSDAEELLVTGVVYLDVASVSSAVTGSTGDSDVAAGYKDGDDMQIWIFGAPAVRFRVAVTAGQYVSFDRATNRWETYTPDNSAIVTTDATKANIDIALASVVARISRRAPARVINTTAAGAVGGVILGPWALL